MQILIIIIMLILSSFFSGSETIFLSTSKIKLEIIFKKRKRGSSLVKNFINNPETFIITTLLGNNITIITYSSILAIFLEKHFSETSGILISSLIALVFAEVIPKAIGWEFSNSLIFKIAPFVRFFQILFSPLIWLLHKISSFIINIFKIKNNDNVYMLTKKDMQSFIQESEEAGLVEKNESEIITNLFQLRETLLKETMVPRTEIIAIKKNVSIEIALKNFQISGFSRLPVYDENIDNIIGVIFAKDLFNLPQTIEEIIHDIKKVPETKSAFSLLQEFRKSKNSIAVVLDEYGGTAGLVTFEDLVEELFGEIYDEYDLDHEHLFKKLDSSTILIHARAEIDELNSKFNFNIPEGDYTTLAGFIIDRLGKIPKKSEKIELDTCTIIITNANIKRVLEVKIIKKNKS